MAAEDLYANWPVPPLAPSDLGVPAPPTPPAPVQVPSAYDPQKASLARLIALAGAIALGPERGGAGLASGVSGELDRREAEHQRLLQLAQQQNEQNQRNYTGEKEKYDSNALGRQKTFESTLQSMRGVVSKLEDQGQYDQQIAGFTNMLRGAGYRVDGNYLRSAIPFVQPTSQSKAGKLLDQAMANAKTWGLSPEQLLDPTHTIEFDANGDGTPEKYTFPQLAALAGRPIVKDETGKPILPAQGDAKIGSPFQEKLGALLADFKATNHRDPTEKEKNTLVDQAIVKSKESPNTAVNVTSPSDTEELAQQLVDGDLVPTLMSRRSGSYNAVLAKANRINIQQTGKPLNFVKLQSDYAAAQTFAHTMNGQQMVRFRGLGNSVVNTIDEVQRLADELKQGGVQLFNSASRGTVMQVFGNTPQSGSAAQYVAAVNTLKEEFANLVQGGGVPTEPAFALANQQINGNYGVKDLTASLAEVRRLISYRLQAIDSQTPFGSGGSIQQPSPTPQPGQGVPNVGQSATDKLRAR